eukprot:COSAG02_NODE_6638_length_3445_cov_3.330135_6_plen_65_part_00
MPHSPCIRGPHESCTRPIALAKGAEGSGEAALASTVQIPSGTGHKAGLMPDVTPRPTGRKVLSH